MVPRQLVPHTMWRMTNFDAVAFIKKQCRTAARRRAKRDAEIDALRAAIVKAELARHRPRTTCCPSAYSI